MQKKNLIIQDITAIGKDGEYYGVAAIAAASDDSTVVIRMLTHIKKLIQYVENAHKKSIEVNSENECITRLTTSEFSFYTKAKPLSIQQYKECIAGINAMANELPPNIHLIIATLPVLWSDGTVHNVGLYVQSPRNSQLKCSIHHFEKRHPAWQDYAYKDQNGDRIPLYSENAVLKPADTAKIVLKDTVVKTNDINQYKSAFKVVSENGNSFLSTIEICLEHTYQYGISDTKELIRQLESKGLSVPVHGSHVLSSNTIEMKADSLVADSLHVDPYEQNNSMQALESQTDTKPFFGMKLQYTLFKPRLVGGIRYENMPYASSEVPTKHIANSIKCRTMSQVTDVKHANIKADIEGMPSSVLAGILISP